MPIAKHINVNNTILDLVASFPNYDTLLEMKNAVMSNSDICYCNETKLFYSYDAEIEPDDTLGKWILFGGGEGVKTYDTVSEMSLDNPKTGTFAFCNETGFYYSINLNNDVDATLGKWREFSSNSKTTSDITLVGTGLGSLKDGDVIPENTTFQQFLEMVCTKVIPPKYIQPTAGFTLSPNTPQEIGTTKNVTITPQYTQNDGGDIISCEIYRNDVLINTQTDLTPFVDSSVLIDGNVVYKVLISYSDGAIKKTNTGVDYPTGQILAGSKQGTGTLNAVYPFYYGTSATIPTDASGLTKSVTSKGNKTYTFSGSEVYAVIIYDSSYGNLMYILDSNGFSYNESFNRSTLTIDGVNYNMYCSNNKADLDGFTYMFRF